MVASYTPTLGALIEARRGLQPTQKNIAKAVLVAEPSAPGLRHLDHVIEEVAAAALIISPVLATTIVGDVDPSLPGKGATRKAVLDALPSASVLHLACHGQQDLDNPLESGFCLRDGRLSIAELMRLNLPQPLLAFLSACETAKGDDMQPDQAVHLAAAMLFTGFRSVIATMW